LTADKKKVEKALKRVEKRYLETLEKIRLDWLRSVYRQAREQGYNFKTLGELVAFIVDHAEDLKKGTREP
jgi:hypothetical protein